MPYQDIFDSRLYQMSEKVSDMAWDVVLTWPQFARDAFGEQFVRSADSIGANIVESAGRYYPLDVIRFLHFARGSVRETQHWAKRALRRRLVNETWHQEMQALLQEILRTLNAYIKFQRTRKVPSSKQAKEPTPTYVLSNPADSEVGDDFDPDVTPWPEL